MASQSKVVPGIHSLLAEAEAAIKKLLLDDANNRGEVKSWLMNTIAHLNGDSLPSTARFNCFDPCSIADSGHISTCSHAADRSRSGEGPRRSSSSSLQDRVYSGSKQQQQTVGPIASCKPAVFQLLHLLCDNKPAAVSALLCRDSTFLCSYLTSSPTVTHAWFGQFSVSGIQHFKFGARALANYALTRRTEVWQYLVWAGKHDQAPVAVAGKPHYFAELNVDKTMLQLARHCPEFWSSEELLKSCDGGDWLKLDSSLIIQELYRLLNEPRSSRHHAVRQLVRSFVTDADWILLCNRLLPLLPDQQLLSFVRLLAAASQQQQQGASCSGSRSRGQRQQQPNAMNCWLQEQAAFNKEAVAAAAAAKDSMVDGSAPAAAAAVRASQLPCVQQPPPVLLSAHAHQWTFSQVLVVNALNQHRRQLLSLIRQDEDAGQQLLTLLSVGQQLIGDTANPQIEAGAPASTPPATAAAVTSAIHAQLLARAKSDEFDGSNPAQLQLQLLLAGWLLWLQLLLAAAAGPDQAGQALQQLGCEGRMLQPQGTAQAIEAAADAAAGQQQQQQQQSQQQSQQQKQEQEQGQQEHQVHHQQLQQPQEHHQQQQQQKGPRQPLRRGAAVTTATHSNSSRGESESSGSSSSNDGGTSGRVQDLEQQHRKQHKLPKLRTLKVKGSRRFRSTALGAADDSRQHVAKRKRRRSGSSSSSSEEPDSSPHRRAKRRKAAKRYKHTKHKLKRKRRRRHSSSSSSGSSSWEDDDSMDLDCGGELLNPTDFPSWTGAAIAGARTTVTVKGTLELKRKQAEASAASDSQHQLAGLLESVGSLSAGGWHWRHQQWIVVLPPMHAAAMVNVHGGQGAVAGSNSAAACRGADNRGFSIIDTAAEVVDAAICYCIWNWMMQLYA